MQRALQQQQERGARCRIGNKNENDDKNENENEDEIDEENGPPVSGAQQLPLPQLHAHAGTGQVDELNEGHQSAAERRHAQSFESRALSEDGTKLLV